MKTNLLINILAFVILTVLWLGFGYALLFNRGLLERTWHTFRGWPLLAKIIVALLTVPVILSLWIWQTRWPAWLRLVLVVGLAWFTEHTFFPVSVF